MYTRKSGQATASVGMSGGDVVVTAGCDSLQTLVAELREELAGTHRYVAEETAERHRGNRMACFMAGLATGLLTVIILKLARFIYGKKRR